MFLIIVAMLIVQQPKPNPPKGISVELTDQPRVCSHSIGSPGCFVVETK